ncbi:MAG: ABC transporter ATP-binding protein, partial [Clostridiales bacterium]|nr:ABC transporter ATP-binding protein [Clostridiales bacterium]
MLKIKKYLKPFIWGVLLAIVLLFGQAMCDLNLPNFMSDIVDTGIMQGGIDHAAPDAISQDGMKFITTFMTDDEKQVVNENYELKSLADKNLKGKTYASLYPKAESDIYVKKDVSKETSEALDNSFGTSLWTFINVMKAVNEQSGQSGQTEQTSDNSLESFQNVDLSNIYQMQPMFDSLPQTQIAAAHEIAIESDSTVLQQTGVMIAKSFYSELGTNVNKVQNNYIYKIGIEMLLIALAGGIATVLVSFISSKVAAGVARNLRKDVFTKIESFSNNEFDKFSTASLITRCTNDITQIQMLLMIGIRLICYAPILGIGGIIMAVRKSASMFWIIAVAVVVLIGMIVIIMAIAMPKFKSIQKLIDRLNLVSREELSGLMVIRAFGTQKHEIERFDDANKNLTKTNLFVNRVMVTMMPMMMLIMNGVSLLIVWVGAHQIANSSMQIGNMMAFIQYSMQIIMSFLMISMIFIFVPRAAVSAERIAEVLGTDVIIKDPVDPVQFLPEKKGFVEFKDVCFRYYGAEEYALSNITFTAKPGETTAIIGPTGSGKSTIANLMLRFYDVSEGKICVDGVDVRDVTQENLRRIIGFVPQKGVLMSGTIESNIKYGN